MIKILSTEQIRKADQYTIQHEPVSSVDLMERAAKAFVKQLEEDQPEKDFPKYIICGDGNNGGDGLAVARILLSRLHKVTVFIFSSEKRTPDNNLNLTRLQKKYKRHIHTIKDVRIIEEIPQDAVIIDAIFGTGLNKAIKKDTIYYKVIEKINERDFHSIISIDIPSGLFADKPTGGIAVIAQRTYTFQFPKLSFLLPENGKYINDFTILDIGLLPEFIQQVKTPFYYLTPGDISGKIHPRKKYSHKGNYGHALMIAGSYGKMGAAVLSSHACLRTGAGLITTHIPSCGYEIFQSSLPEAMCSTDKNKEYISDIPSGKYDAIAVGPGIGTHDVSVNAFESFLKTQDSPIIIDADGLNILSKKKKILDLVPPGSILTPHPKEFERLAGKWKNDFERLELQRKFSKEHLVIIVLKGAYTGITDPVGNVYFNSTGNPGMATAGSGDVLTGIILGFLAQQYTPLNSAILGVYIHGLAGDKALQSQSMESMIASDIIANLGNAFKEITK